MNDQVFPPEVPQIDELVRITSLKEGRVPREYKFICEESCVVSRFFAIDHSDSKHIVVYLSGTNIKSIHFNLANKEWITAFNGQYIQAKVEKILE